MLSREEEEGCGGAGPDGKLVWRLREGKCLPLGKVHLRAFLRKEENGIRPLPHREFGAVPPTPPPVFMTYPPRKEHSFLKLINIIILFDMNS